MTNNQLMNKNISLNELNNNFLTENNNEIMKLKNELNIAYKIIGSQKLKINELENVFINLKNNNKYIH